MNLSHPRPNGVIPGRITHAPTTYIVVIIAEFCNYFSKCFLVERNMCSHHSMNDFRILRAHFPCHPPCQQCHPTWGTECMRIKSCKFNTTFQNPVYCWGAESAVIVTYISPSYVVSNQKYHVRCCVTGEIAVPVV